MDYGTTLTREIDQAANELGTILNQRYATVANHAGTQDLLPMSKADVAKYLWGVATMGLGSAYASVVERQEIARWMQRYTAIEGALAAIRYEITGADMIDGALVAKQKQVIATARRDMAELR